MTKAKLGQLFAQTRLELRPGPEQAQTRFNLEQQGPWVIQADLGTETIGPGGQKLLQALDLQRVVFDTGKLLGQGMGRRQRLPGAQAQGAGGGVDGLQHAPLRRAGQQRQRLLGFGVHTLCPVQRQLREDNTHPTHGNLNAPPGQSAPDGPARHGT